MNRLALTLSLFLIGSVSFGARSVTLPTTLTCLSRDSQNHTVTVGLVPVGSASRVQMIVLIDSKLVYRVASTVKVLRDRREVESAEFMNRNHAPSSLFMSVFPASGQLTSQFYEVSYLPTVGPASQMNCLANSTITF